MKKPLKITLITLGSILAFILLLFILISLFGGCIAKSYVNKHAEDLIGRKASVEHVGLNLFTGHVNIRGLEVKEDDGVKKFAGFDTLDVSVVLRKLLGQTVDVRHITLAGLDAQVIQQGTRFNFTSIIEHFQKDSTEVEEPEDTTASPWVVNLHNIRIAHSGAHYSDLGVGSHWGVNDLNITVPDFSIGGKDATDAGITLELEDGGSLTADAEYNASTNDFDATLKLDKFTLNQILPYLTSSMNIEAIKGLLKVDAKAKGNLSHILDMAISAQASLDGVEVLSQGSFAVASLSHLGVDLNKLVLSENLYDIAKVELSGLNASYELFADSTNTVSRLLKKKEPAPEPAAEAADTTPAQPKKPMQLHVGHLALSDINLTYADHTLPEPFRFPVTNIRLQADDLTLSGSNNARLFANLPHGGAAILNWKGTIADWKQSQDLRLTIKDLHLTDLSPYLLAFFGQPFTEGVFSFTSYNTIHHSQLKGENKIDIYKPTIGDRRKDIDAKLHLPLKAALYILKDKDEKVILDVPIAGNIDSPEFNYMKLVWKTLGNLIVKVATSPARALGDLFKGSEGDDKVFMAFDPEENDFSSEQFYQIDKLADLAKRDESYILNFDLLSSPTQDSTMAASNRRRNAILTHHLNELGLPATQYSITSTQDENAVPGYNITIQIKE